MMMYKLTIDQKNSLFGRYFAKDSLFNPVQDINGDWFISRQEIEQCSEEEFMWIKELIPFEYIPPLYSEF